MQFEISSFPAAMLSVLPQVDDKVNQCVCVWLWKQIMTRFIHLNIFYHEMKRNHTILFFKVAKAYNFSDVSLDLHFNNRYSESDWSFPFSYVRDYDLQTDPSPNTIFEFSCFHVTVHHPPSV